jgi:uncharacterized protein DUF6544
MPGRVGCRRVADLDEPVRRYFDHALPSGPPASPGVRLTMRGRIKVGWWLPFTGEWEGDGRSFEWRARVARGLMSAVDRYAGGEAGMDVRLLGRVPLVHEDDVDTVRSAAGRAAVEAALWAPGSLVPERGVTWRAETDREIVATWDVPPERPEVRLRIDARGAVESVLFLRWDDGSHGHHGYTPCGGTVQAERRFGDLVVPSRLTVGWWFETPNWWPFFEVEILSAEPLG